MWPALDGCAGTTKCPKRAGGYSKQWAHHCALLPLCKRQGRGSFITCGLSASVFLTSPVQSVSAYYLFFFFCSFRCLFFRRWCSCAVCMPVICSMHVSSKGLNGREMWEIIIYTVCVLPLCCLLLRALSHSLGVQCFFFFFFSCKRCAH